MGPAASSFLLALAAAAAAGGCGPEADPAADAAVRTAAAEDAKWADDVGDIPFVIGLAAGTKAAAASGRPPMYYFTTTWCGYCRQMAQTGFKDADAVAKIKANFTPILLDGDDKVNAGLAWKYRVQVFPTIVFADADGTARDVVVGADVERFKNVLARLTP
jgi:thiol-disulfide isomerase/thioredoxin